MIDGRLWVGHWLMSQDSQAISRERIVVTR